MSFEIVRRTPLSASVAWERITDWERHSDWMPFTTVTRLPGPTTGVGSGFNARTSIGPVGFDDPMEVTFWRPPDGETTGLCRIIKRGRVLLGGAVLTVTPDPSGGSEVSWREQADIRLGGPLLRKPTAVFGKLVFSRLIDHLLA